jgi:hypothetical protein
MGANAQTSVPVFTIGQVLTAQQQTEINTGIPVFADSTARDAAFGGTGEKTLAEGQFAFLEDTDTTQYYDGSSWETVGVAPGLVFITGASFSTVTSFSLPADTFSTTYKNYKVFIDVNDATVDCDLTMRMRASGADNTTTNYQTQMPGYKANGTAINDFVSSGGTSWLCGEVDAAVTTLQITFDIMNPQTAEITALVGAYYFIDKAVTYNGFRDGVWNFSAATQFDSFSFISSVADSISGYYRIYGYSES